MSAHALTLFLALSAPAAPVPDLPVYKWNFEKGKTFYQEVTTDTKADVKVMGVAEKTRQKQTHVYSYTPVRENGGGWVIRRRVEAVAVEIDYGNGMPVVKYNSASDKGEQTDPLAQLARATVGWECTITVDGKGKVTDVETGDEALKKFAKDNPEQAKIYGYMFDKDTLKEEAAGVFNALPGKEVVKGDSWQRASRTSLGPFGQVESKTEYTYAGKDKAGLDKFEVNTVEFKYHPPVKIDVGIKVDVANAEFKTKKATGAIYFDSKRGRIERTEGVVEMDGKMTLKLDGNEITIEMTETQTTTVKTSGSNPAKQ